MTTPIIGPLPVQLSAGQLVSAGPVMANFNYIVAQVNQNIQVPLTLSRVALSGVGATFLTTGVPKVMGITGGGMTVTKQLDTLSEFSTTTGLFTASQAGVYLIQGSVMGLANTATYTAEPSLVCRHNGTAINQPIFLADTIGAFDTEIGFNFAVVSIAQGDTLSLTVTKTFTGGPPFIQNLNMGIIGLGA